MKTLFLFSLSVFMFSGVWSQSPDENHKKYWYYRHRLKEHFMYDWHHWQAGNLILSERAGPFGNSNATFGDQTIHLGNYIAILAMEYHLLASNGQNTDETIKDLYSAIYSVNRLDLNAESLFRGLSSGRPNPVNNDLNGFFVKDDAGRYINTGGPLLSHINSNKIKSVSYNINDVSSQWKTSFLAGIYPYSRYPSKYKDFDDYENKYYSAEMSQDQFYYLLFGMRMINEFIPTSINFNGKPFQDGVVSFHEEAAEIALRMTSHINQTSHTSIPSYIGIWAPINPITKNKLHFPQHIFQWSYPIAEITADITSNYYSKRVGTAYTGWKAQHTLYSITNGRNLWGGGPGVLGTNNFFTTPDNTHMCGLLNAMFGRSNFDATYYAGYKAREMYHIPLIGQVLYNQGNPVHHNVYRDILNDAPCDEPYISNEDRSTSSWGKSPNTGKYSFEFSTSDRLLHPYRRWPNKDMNIDFDGEFPGIDYMLYHNLYYIVNSKEYSNPVNWVNMDIKKSINSGEYNVLKKLTGSNSITSLVFGPWFKIPYNVTYRAGEEINFKPGFSTNTKSVKGSYFHAYVERIDCSNKVGTSNTAFAPRSSGESAFKPDSSYQPINKRNFKRKTQDVVYHESINVLEINESKINIFPNPATNFVNIIGKGQYITKKMNIKVYDSKGSMIDFFEFQNIIKKDVSSYPNGILILQILDDENQLIETKKIIKSSKN